MTNIQSKILTCSCKEFAHPWTDSCVKSVAGFLIQGSMHSLKIYSFVYALSLLMRRKIPTKDDIVKTIIGIAQSAAFLTANGGFFIGFMCLWRQIFGHWTFLGATFWPCFYASFLAILIENPARRVLLTTYVINEATETLWNILESQGYVTSIANAQVALFAIGMSMIIYMYKLGLHNQRTYKDPVFNVLNWILGKQEGGPISKDDANGTKDLINSTKKSIYQKHRTCNHKEESCAKAAVLGGLKPLAGGLLINFAMKLASSLKSGKISLRKLFFEKEFYSLGIFLGGFSFLFKGTSCLMRHLTDNDKPEYSIISALVASCAAFKYKRSFISLYVLIKAIQLYCYWGCEEKVLPSSPNFQIILYSTATAILFHAAQYQPTALRPSYWKFLFDLSGARVALFNRHVLAKFGMESYQSLQKTLKQTKTLGKPLLWPMV